MRRNSLYTTLVLVYNRHSIQFKIPFEYLWVAATADSGNMKWFVLNLLPMWWCTSQMPPAFNLENSESFSTYWKTTLKPIAFKIVYEFELMVCKQQKSWHTTAYRRDLVISVSCNELKQNNRLFKTNHRPKWPPNKSSHCLRFLPSFLFCLLCFTALDL